LNPNSKITAPRRSGGLAGSSFSFGSGDPNYIQSLCITLSFLPHRVRIAMVKKPQLYQANMDHRENKPLVYDVIHVKQDEVVE